MLNIGVITLIAGMVHVMMVGINFNNSMLLVIAACCLSTYFLKRKSWRGNNLDSDKQENI